MKPEIVTNLLDTAAFFMVTIDLYGRERLAALSDRLRNLPLPRLDLMRPLRGSQTGQRFWAQVWSDKDSASAPALFVRVLMVLVGCSPIYAAIYLFLQWRFGGGIGWADVANALFWAFVGMSAAVAFGGLLMAMFWAVWAFARIVGHLFHLIATHAKIDGAMLTFGAIVYVASRAFAIWTA
jgi:hypothetical protein